MVDPDAETLDAQALVSFR